MIRKTKNYSASYVEIAFSGKDLRNLERCRKAAGDPDLETALARIVSKYIKRRTRSLS